VDQISGEITMTTRPKNLLSAEREYFYSRDGSAGQTPAGNSSRGSDVSAVKTHRHSPQRQTGSIGVVVEMPRPKELWTVSNGIARTATGAATARR